MKKIRVLIVDEKAFVRDAMKRSLRRFLRDVETHDALNGQRAISALRTNRIDLILCQWDMQEMPGVELLRWVRDSEHHKKIPFIVMSDTMERNMVTTAAEGGASDFLQKPFSPDEVQKKVVKQLARIGYNPKNNRNAGDGKTSADLLTGGVSSATIPNTSAQNTHTQPADALETASTAPAPKRSATKKASSKSSKSSAFAGSAQLEFENYAMMCDLKELSLAGFSGLIQRPNDDVLPTIFHQATAEIMDNKGDSLGRFQVFVAAIYAFEPKLDADRLRINLRFTTNEPEQFEALSRVITNHG